MKIIIVGPSHPYRGGIAAFTDRLANEFQVEGADVELYTFTLQYPSILFPGKTQYSDAPAPEDIKIFRKINSINPFTWIKTAKEIKAKNPDIVVFAYWMSFFAPCYAQMAKIISKNKNTRCIGLVHNMMPHERSLLDRLLSPCFVKRMHAFAALSKSVLNDVSKLDKKSKPKLFSPHPLYDHYGDREDKAVALSSLYLDDNYNYLLFFGLIREYKGLDLLLKAMSDDRLDNYPLKLIVAGEFYEKKEPYLQMIDNLDIKDRVIICDKYIPDEEVKNFFNLADMVVQPYKSATQSGVTQVAYHFEKPMLVTDVGGLREIVPNGKVGYVVEPEPKKIADAICDFYDNDRKEFFEANIVEEKKKYEWSKMTETIMKLYKETKQL
ncbi:MAG: glycosyltransferase [Lentimicrobiaceae bacterium]|nr:glycosyltransferase [Lentimicrobiaceae bacterium]